ncbi:hypothetical protein J5X98_22935 [Leptothermofonsia sichuanensis E412]|uniref:hypothetical protein n=1 Tax=Leptothermofonsia sichuanensis TaxID=2917832 RepID=UPI001CA664EE|nr:hypothetical protein [Leptothermofonsia sichuanensis]QZZ20106.1 hypothetical protein J5X98_22935 [Leptothermofonsia sichuanensis E412]
MLIILRVTTAWTAPTSLDRDQHLSATLPGVPLIQHNAPPDIFANHADGCKGTGCRHCLAKLNLQVFVF